MRIWLEIDGAEGWIEYDDFHTIAVHAKALAKVGARVVIHLDRHDTGEEFFVENDHLVDAGGARLECWSTPMIGRDGAELWWVDALNRWVTIPEGGEF